MEMNTRTHVRLIIIGAGLSLAVATTFAQNPPFRFRWPARLNRSRPPRRPRVSRPMPPLAEAEAAAAVA